MLCRPYIEALTRLEPDRQSINTDNGKTYVRPIRFGPLVAYMNWAGIDDADFLDTFQSIDAAYVRVRNEVSGGNKKVITFGNGGG